MKTIATTVMAFAFLAPFAAYAQTSAPSEPISLPTDEQIAQYNPIGLVSSPGTITCPEPAASNGVVAGLLGKVSQAVTGGAGGNVFGNLGGGGFIPMNCFMEGQPCSGGGGGATNLLGGLLGGSNGGILQNPQQLMSILSSDNVATELLQRFGPQLAQQVLSSLNVGNIGSAIGGFAGGTPWNIGGGAGSALGNLGGGLSGGAGGLLGGVTALAGGEMAVPTIEKNRNLLKDIETTREHARQIQDYEATQVAKDCIYDPTTMKLYRRIVNDMNAQTLKYVEGGRGNGKSFINKTPSRTRDLALLEGARQVLAEAKNSPSCSEFEPAVIRIFAEEIADADAEINAAAPAEEVSCPAIENESPRDRLMRLTVTEDNPAVRYLVLVEKRERKVEQISYDLEHITADGLISPVKCYDENRNLVEGTFEECPGSGPPGTPGTFEVTNTAANIGAAYNDATLSAKEQAAQSDEAGESVDPLVLNLLGQLFEFGLSFLSKPSSNGGGSYLDQISGNGNAGSIETARGYVARTIAGGIALQNEYQGALSSMLGNLNQVKSAYDMVRQCYAALGASGGAGGLSSSDALARANTASTTVAVIFNPQITQRTDQLNNARAVSQELARLASEARRATTVEQVNAVSDAYDALKAAGLIPGGAEIAFLKNDRDASAAALQVAIDGAGTALTECQSFSGAPLP